MMFIRNFTHLISEPLVSGRCRGSIRLVVGSVDHTNVQQLPITLSYRNGRRFLLPTLRPL